MILKLIVFLKHNSEYCMQKSKHILFVTPHLFTFVQKDIDFLKKHYEVTIFIFNAKKKWLTPFLFVKQFFFILSKIFKTEIYICKFPGYLSIIPCIIAKLTNKKCLLITAGTESAGIPSINYGNFNKKVLGFFTKLSFKLATHIAPVHKSLMLQDYIYHKEIYPQQGVLFFCKNLKTPYTEINYGFDPEKWVIGSEQRKPNSVAIIAAGFENRVVFLRKGLDLIFEIANKLPDFSFTIIGCEPNSPILNPPKNIVLMQKINQTELTLQFQKHEFYAQLSMFEGFPNALCEAMLCGCIPFGSSVSAIPDIIGDTGFILKEKNTEELIKLFQKAQTCNKQELSSAARNRIIKEYHYSIRERKLKVLIDDLINS